ncbi:hypothetical protein CJU89_3632 [Yarrowia sp. B02]|nr:hypothetical protein CJU89_3632 [Yarrowia sp. B02]
MGRGVKRKDQVTDWILEHYCDKVLSQPTGKNLGHLKPLVAQHLRSVGGYHGAGINVLKFCLITRNLLSSDRSTRFDTYATDVNEILGGMARILGFWLDSSPHLAISDPDKTRATVAAEKRSIMVIVARECFYATVDRDAFSRKDLEDLKELFNSHQKWYDDEDRQQFAMYIELLESSESPIELLRTASVLAHSLLEAFSNDRPIWRRLAEFSDYMIGHITAMRNSVPVYQEHRKEGLKKGMSAIQIANTLAKREKSM